MEGQKPEAFTEEREVWVGGEKMKGKKEAQSKNLD